MFGFQQVLCGNKCLNLTIVFLYFFSSLGAKEEDKGEKESATSYSECGSVGVSRVEKVFGKLESKYFTKKISMKEFLRDWLVPLNIALTKFLSKAEEEIDDSDYYEEALSFTRFDSEKIAECFFNSYQTNNSIYHFKQRSNQGLVEGYAIVDKGRIKTVYYKNLVLI